jgi:hypothetical protein
MFEKFVFKVMNPNGYAINEDPTKHLVLKKRPDFIDTFGDKYFLDAEGKRKSFVMEWLEDPKKRYYKYFDLLPPPLECPPKVFNLWRGFDIENTTCESSNDVEPFLKHISILANHDQQSIDFILNYFAQLFQKPGEITGIALTFISISQGSGKNILIDFISKILGKYYYQYTNCPMNDLFENHADGFVNKLLVDIDEISQSDLEKCGGRLKSEITCEVRTFNPKQLSRITMRNFARIIVTSNELRALPIDNNDRRWAVFEPSCEKVANTKYFNGLAKYMNNPCNQRAVYDYLLKRDLSDVDWRNSRPATDLYKDLTTSNANDILMFVANLCRESFKNEIQKFTIKGGELYTKYKAYMDKLHQKPKNRNVFPMDMRAYCRESNQAIKYSNTNNKNVYTFDIPLLINYLTSRRMWDSGYMIEEEEEEEEETPDEIDK